MSVASSTSMEVPGLPELACAPSGAISARNGDEAAESLEVISR
jgi:hypothetical protein